jgi:hypothetical protein
MKNDEQSMTNIMSPMVPEEETQRRNSIGTGIENSEQ